MMKILTYYVITTKSKVSHFGQKTRKDSTASSNVNEFDCIFFLHKRLYRP